MATNWHPFDLDRAILNGKTKNPSKEGTGLDASHNARVFLEGRRRIVLDILFLRMSENPQFSPTISRSLRRLLSFASVNSEVEVPVDPPQPPDRVVETTVIR